MAIVRELVTRLSFRADNSAVQRFDRNIGALRQNIGRTTQNMRALSQTARNVGFGLTAFVTAPITALGALSLKTASDLEKAQIALEVFLGSEEKAIKLQKELLQFAKITPFQALGIQDTAGQLLAVGIEAEKIVPTLNALGNAAKGNQEIFQRLVLNFGQVRTQGKLTGRELRDFLVNQVPLVKLLAKEMNVAESEIKDMVSRGDVTFEVVEKAFMNASKEGGFFFDLMKKQSKTLAGAWSNLIDVITIFSAKIGESIDEILGIRKMMKSLTIFLEKAEERFSKLSLGTRKLILMMALFLASIGPIVLAIGGLIFVLSLLTAPMLGIIALIGLLSAAIFLIVEDFIVWANGGESLIGDLLGNFEDFKTKIIPILELVRDTFKNFWEGIVKGDEEAIERFEKNMEELLPIIAKALGKLTLLLSQVIGIMLKVVVGSIFRLLRTIFDPLEFMNELEDLLDKIVDKLREKFPFLGNLFLKSGESDGKVSDPNQFNPFSVLSGGSGFAGVNNPVGLGNPGISNVNMRANNNITLELPRGTSQEMGEEAARVISDVLNEQVNSALTANPVDE